MIELLKKISNEGIIIDVKEGKLNLLTSQKNIDQSILSEIKANKDELISFLSKNKNLELKEEVYKEIPICEKAPNYELSNAQRRLWLASQHKAGTNAYNMPNTIELKGDYDVENFKKAVHAVIQRHEILRTVFKMDEKGNIRQYIIQKDTLEFSIDYKNYQNENNPLKEAKAFITSDSHKFFDLEKGPLIRASLLQVSEKKYLFYYNINHIVSDGWSMEVLERDLMIFYKAFSTNSLPKIPPLRIQYKDYAAWQLNKLDSDDYKRHKNYWLKRFSGELPVTDLPSYNFRPKVKTSKGKRLSAYLSSDLTNRLDGFLKDNGGSLFMLMLSVLNVLLHKYTAQKDIIIGSPFAGRVHPDLEDQIGFYVNNLVFRNTIKPSETFIEFYNRVKQSVLDDYGHQDYPFDKLVEDLSIRHNQGRAPLTDISFTLHDKVPEVASKDLTIDIETTRDRGYTISKNDVEFHITPLADVISLEVIFTSDVYSDDMVTRMITHLKQLCTNLLSNPKKTISRIEYLSQKERHELLNAFKSSEISNGKNLTVVDVFKEQIQKTPNGTAVVFGSKKLTYKELDERSNQVANRLIDEYNITVGDFVGVHLDRSVEYIICFLGILKAGAVNVPIDIKFSKDRKEFIINDSAVEVLITDTDYLLDMDYFKGEFLTMSLKAEDSVYTVGREVNISPTDIAFIIYTSGSTGAPKGIIIKHEGILNTTLSFIERLNLKELNRCLQFASFSYDVSILEICNSLLSGSVLYTTDDETRKSPKRLEAYLQKNKIETAILPSAVFKLMNPKNLSSIKALITMGKTPIYDKVVSYLKTGGIFYNAYGHIETGICATIHKVEELSDLDPNYMSLGEPIFNTNIYILDAYNNLQPIGVEGELCVSGSGIAKGYLNQEELTKEKFVDHPIKKGEKLFRTGDLARWLPDGSIELRGRKDHQIKIRGHRLELGRIESAINNVAQIDNSVIIASEINDNSKELVAYFVASSRLDTKEIQKKLEEQLPEYMVPNLYMQLDAIPQTNDGKIDYKSLPAPDVETTIDTTEEFTQAVTPEQKVLMSVWVSVLGVKQVSTKDNFYNLGGDSIRSIQIVSRVRQHGYKLKVGDILSNPILENMASLMESGDIFIDQSEVEGKVPLTPIQHYLFNNPSIKNPHHFNQSVLIKSKKRLDLEGVKQCISKLMKHHDALRMIYSSMKGTWDQYNRAFSEDCFAIESYDFVAHQNGAKEMGSICENLQRSLDFTKGPLFVIGHFSFEDGDRLALICHHLLVDAVSWRILLEDISTLYSQYISGKNLKLPLKTNSFRQWSIAQEVYAESEEIEIEFPYWEGLHNLVIEPFPIEKGTRDTKKPLNNRISFTLEESLTNLMQTTTHKVYNTEINDLLLSALGMAIKDIFDIDKTVVEMEGHGREDIIKNVDVNRTVGWFTSVYPIVLEVSKSENPIHSLIKIKDDLREIPKKGIGHGILKHLAERFDKMLEPAVQFNYLGDFGNKIGSEEKDPIFQFSSEYIGKSMDPENLLNALMSISGAIYSGTLNMAISYCSDLYTEETMQRLSNSYKSYLKLIIKDLSSEQNTYLTPSDLTFPELTLNELQELNSDNLIEDVYELSPAQQGIYYHWFTQGDSYFEQITYGVKGVGLNMEYFKIAFDTLIQRYPILRTSFTNKYADTLLQIVKKSVSSSFSHLKAPSDITREEKIAWVETMKRLDREKGFDLEEYSQMRLTILGLGNNEYEFVWSHHHILMDGWCTSILINDFYRILQSLEHNNKLELPKINPYSEYIKWLGNVNEKETLRFWKDYLKGYNTTAKVPFQLSQIQTGGYEFSKETIKLTGDIYEKINTLCNEMGITHNNFIQTIWGYLLSRYNDTNDVVFGSVVSGRPGDLEGAEEMVGLFLNTIPIRIQYQECESVQDLLKKTKEESIKSLPHHYVSLSAVQGKSELGMSLLDHIMIFENFPIQELIEEQLVEESQEGSSTLEFESVDFNGKTNYDFNIAIAMSDISLRVHFEYNKNRYEESGIKRLSEHFYKLVESFVNQPKTSLKELNYLTLKEKSLVLDKFNPTRVEIAKDESLLSLFKQQVIKSPNSAAVVFDNQILTYEELDQRSTNLAHHLLGKGATTGDLIGIYIDKSLEMVVAVLGVLKVAGTYIPIDPDYPEDRINYIIQDTQMVLCLTSQKYNPLLRNRTEAEIIVLDGEQVMKDNLEEVNIEASNAPDHLVYVIYTSGSTGKPKGVMVPQLGLLNLADSCKKEYHLNSATCLLQTASFSFDQFPGQLFRNIITGGIMVLCPREKLLDFDNLYVQISKWKITTIEMTPTLAIEFMEYIHDNKLDVSWMKLLILGGDIVQVSDYQKLLDNFGSNMRIINSYGTTETTIDNSYYETANSDALIGLSNVPIGKPMQNNSFYVLDKYKRPAAIGVVGELYIGGDGLAKGYLNQAELTSEKFIDHPFKQGELLYKTGDFAKWMADGIVEFIGRKDDQIKIRGYRIELGEIEAILDKIPQIKRAVVLALENSNGINYLVAYIVFNEVLETTTVQQTLGKSLPQYMIPRIYVELEEIPMTSNGKVDRKALALRVPDSQQKYEEPSTETEQQLVVIWKAALAVEKIGIHDNYFELGGNSLSAIRIILKIRKELEVEIDIKSLFNFNTIAELSLQLDFSKKQEELSSNAEFVKQIL